jgi:hypothetical protein
VLPAQTRRQAMLIIASSKAGTFTSCFKAIKMGIHKSNLSVSYVDIKRGLCQEIRPQIPNFGTELLFYAA